MIILGGSVIESFNDTDTLLTYLKSHNAITGINIKKHHFDIKALTSLLKAKAFDHTNDNLQNYLVKEKITTSQVY